MEVCYMPSLGVPAWGPSMQTKNLIATGTSTEAERYLLKISKYDVNSTEGLEL